MNVEESRLRTFKNWPSNAPVDATRIAKAGFYYMGQHLEVQCFSCGGRISEWNYSDKVMTLHKALDPRCPFVINPALSGNVPVADSNRARPNGPINQGAYSSSLVQVVQDSEVSDRNQDLVSSPSSTLIHSVHMQLESHRLETFTNWPVPFIVSPKDLAEAGFYYVHQGDKVRCAYCSVIIGRWEVGDNPMLEHRRHSPGCSFVHADLSRPLSTELNTSNATGVSFRQNCGDHFDGSMKSLGVKVHRVAKHPKYNSKDSRLASYTLWPKNIPQTPEDLSEAGFYYTGSDDQVRCFHCDGGLRQWEPNDNPWIEHARWFPECGYVLSVKGGRFIDDSILQYPPTFPELETRNIKKVSQSRMSNNSPQVRQVLEEEVEALMSSPTAMAVLQIGLDFSRVKMAIRKKIEQTGVPFSSSHDLVEATLDIQLDEIPFQDCEEVWSTPLNSPLHRKRVSKVLHKPVPQEDTDSSDSEMSENCIKCSLPIGPEMKSTEDPELQNNVSINNIDKKVNLEEENRRLREARLCKICMDNEVCIVFLPCGHLVTCVNCAHSLAACPLCRKHIKATVRTFLP